MIAEIGTRFCGDGHRVETGLNGERNLQTREPGHIEHLLARQYDGARRAAVHGDGVGHEEESEET
jgi:hypothetical protein